MNEIFVVKKASEYRGAEVFENMVCGNVACTFSITRTAWVWIKRSHYVEIPQTQRLVRFVAFHTVDNKAVYSDGHLFYKLWVFMPSVKRYVKCDHYQAEFEPIYDAIWRMILIERPGRVKVSCDGNMFAGRKEAPKQYDYRMYRPGYTLFGGVMTEGGDRCDRMRVGVCHTGFAR